MLPNSLCCGRFKLLKTKASLPRRTPINQTILSQICNGYHKFCQSLAPSFPQPISRMGGFRGETEELGLEPSKALFGYPTLVGFIPFLFVLLPPDGGTIVYTCTQIDHNTPLLWQSSRSCLRLVVSCELWERPSL